MIIQNYYHKTTRINNPYIQTFQKIELGNFFTYCASLANQLSHHKPQKTLKKHDYPPFLIGKWPFLAVFPPYRLVVSLSRVDKVRKNVDFNVFFQGVTELRWLDMPMEVRGVKTLVFYMKTAIFGRKRVFFHPIGL